MPLLLFALAATVLFIAMAIGAESFRDQARWFPQYVGTAAAAISAITAALAAVSVLRARRRAFSGTDDGPAPAVQREAASSDMAGGASHRDTSPSEAAALSNEAVLVRGIGWLAVWAGFVVLVMAVGFVPGSLIWLGIWFRTMHRWSFRVLIPVLVGVYVLLWIADEFLNFEFPGGSGWFGSFLADLGLIAT